MRRSWWVSIVFCTVLASACRGGGGSTDEDGLDAAPVSGDRPVQVVGDGRVRLFGTLNVPSAATQAAVPGVLIVPSAGPGDRNGITDPMGNPDGLAADLARALSDAGIASYRYDRRGTGESKVEPGTPLSFDAQVADARAAVDLLAQRRETAGRDLTVVGYDQGGLVALRLAATDSRVKRLVLVSAPGRSIVDVQAAALERAYGPESAASLRSTVAGLVATRTLPPLDTMRTELRPLLPPQEAPSLADLYGLDPVADAANVRVPTLIVVPKDPAPYDPARLAGAIPGAEVLTATAAGPTLLITGTAADDERSDPASASHEHGMAASQAPEQRDLETIARIRDFIAAPRP